MKNFRKRLKKGVLNHRPATAKGRVTAHSDFSGNPEIATIVAMQAALEAAANAAPAPHFVTPDTTVLDDSRLAVVLDVRQLARRFDFNRHPDPRQDGTILA